MLNNPGVHQHFCELQPALWRPHKQLHHNHNEVRLAHAAEVLGM